MIELMVVIAIVGILASLLLPVLSRAQGKAQATLCAGNMRQVGIAARIWANDRKGEYPEVKGNSTTALWNRNRFVGFGVMLEDVMQHEERMFACPSSSLMNRDYTNGIVNVGVTGKIAHASYYFRGTRQKAPRSPGDTKGNVLYSDFDALSPTNTTVWLNQNHKTGKNALFKDGHVEFVTGLWDSRFHKFGGDSAGKRDGTWTKLDWKNHVGSASDMPATKP